MSDRWRRSSFKSTQSFSQHHTKMNSFTVFSHRGNTRLFNMPSLNFGTGTSRQNRQIFCSALLFTPQIDILPSLYPERFCPGRSPPGVDTTIKPNARAFYILE
jgi:hypothetical protein